MSYRPQLFIGQRLADGRPIFWDCEWIWDGSFDLDESGIVSLKLFSLPEAVLQVDESVEFYEGGRRVAVGRITQVAD